MGLHISHGCWDSSYSSFNAFRHNLARQIGIDLNDYIGYGGHKDLSKINHDIVPLLDHGDCDGVLNVQECKKVYSGFGDILASYDPGKVSMEGFILYIVGFRYGLFRAINSNEDVIFS